jgi:transcriptional regulator with XRE-family HTH domain
MQVIDTKQAIGERLKQYRMDREWSISHLSKLTGIASSVLWYLEQGREPAELTVHKLRKRLPGFLEDEA